MLRVKRVYDKVSDEDGVRILVDRIWPRAMSKERANLDLWLKEIAPSGRLRKWFGHDEKKWDQFKEQYYKELGSKDSLIAQIVKKVSSGNVTLLFGAKNQEFNNAVALKQYIEERQKNSAISTNYRYL